ncbi:MAG: hypothetical protein AAF756_07260 [Pseudomonadota bacterium]
MNRPIRAALSCLCLAVPILAGCKIQVSSSTGGSVRTLSGSLTCAPGAACPEVDVSTTTFDETFVAEPDDGFVFDGWRRRDRGLCGGSSDPCRLFTSGFAGNDILLAFLASDDVFFLEAVFEPESDPGSGTGSGSDCWNSALQAEGTTILTTRRSTGIGPSIDTDFEQTIAGSGPFNGRTGRLVTTLSSAMAGGMLVSGTSRSYFQDVSDARILNLGTETEIDSPDPSIGSTTAVDQYEPPRLERRDLSAGESYTQEFEETQSTTIDGETTTFIRNIARTVTFDGIESITVPAGTFDACRFTEVEVSAGETSTLQLWYGVGNGLILRVQEDGDTGSVLVSGSINGMDI